MADNPFSVQVVNPMQALLLGQKAYGDAQEQQKQQAIAQARQQAAGQFGSGDYKSALSTLLGAGDHQGAQLAATQLQNAWTQQHTTQRDAVADQHWSVADRRAAAAEGRAAKDFENTPDQYVPNPKANEPGQPAYIDQYAAAKAAGEAVGNGGNPEVGLQPAYGTNAAGEPAAIQFSKTGKAIQTQMPEGFKIAREPIKMDLGTHYQMFDPITRQAVGNPIAKNIAGAEKAKEEGSAAGVANVALPQVLANSEQIIKTIDGIKSHPGKKYALGPMSMAPTIPGTPQADFRARLDQLKGQTFLQAYQTLRGGGAITDIEGRKGEEALVRMQTAQTQDSFDSALDDFKTVVKDGMQRAKDKARGVSSPDAAPPAVVDYKTYFGH